MCAKMIDRFCKMIKRHINFYDYMRPMRILNINIFDSFFKKNHKAFSIIYSYSEWLSQSRNFPFAFDLIEATVFDQNEPY